MELLMIILLPYNYSQRIIFSQGMFAMYAVNRKDTSYGKNYKNEKITEIVLKNCSSSIVYQ